MGLILGRDHIVGDVDKDVKVSSVVGHLDIGSQIAVAVEVYPTIVLGLEYIERTKHGEVIPVTKVIIDRELIAHLLDGEGRGSVLREQGGHEAHEQEQERLPDGIR